MQISLTVPALLADCLGGRRHVFFEAETLADALSAMVQQHPLLRPHLFDETGRPRRHVVIFFNGESIARIADPARPLRPGDQLLVVQAVSGG